MYDSKWRAACNGHYLELGFEDVFDVGDNQLVPISTLERAKVKSHVYRSPGRPSWHGGVARNDQTLRGKVSRFINKDKVYYNNPLGGLEEEDYYHRLARGDDGAPNLEDFEFTDSEDPELFGDEEKADLEGCYSIAEALSEHRGLLNDICDDHLNTGIFPHGTAVKVLKSCTSVLFALSVITSVQGDKLDDAIDEILRPSGLGF